MLTNTIPLFFKCLCRRARSIPRTSTRSSRPSSRSIPSSTTPISPRPFRLSSKGSSCSFSSFSSFSSSGSTFSLQVSLLTQTYTDCSSIRPSASASADSVGLSLASTRASTSHFSIDPIWPSLSPFLLIFASIRRILPLFCIAFPLLASHSIHLSILTIPSLRLPLSSAFVCFVSFILFLTHLLLYDTPHIPQLSLFPLSRPR
jgi:hypothetical protein